MNSPCSAALELFFGGSGTDLSRGCSNGAKAATPPRLRAGIARPAAFAPLFPRRRLRRAGNGPFFFLGWLLRGRGARRHPWITYEKGEPDGPPLSFPPRTCWAAAIPDRGRTAHRRSPCGRAGVRHWVGQPRCRRSGPDSRPPPGRGRPRQRGCATCRDRHRASPFR